MDQRLKPAGEAPWIPAQGRDDEEEGMMQRVFRP
jgi:hypothetical protein